LSVDVIGRYARASDFKGDWTEIATSGGRTSQASGSDRYFYYYEYMENGARYSNLNFSRTGPSDAVLVRKGIVDLTGFSVSVGIKYALGK
ncbi:MAG: hypothetical protein NTZ26_05165, partial [Candidatus Aminicenantes bacterium]|nr:hypothetical protein [Candidatus Aminicenantes bacterium]